jgi:hypothetical protein
VAEVEQELRGVDRPGELVDGDERHRVGPAGLDRHQRDAGGQVDERVGRLLLRRDDEDPVDALDAQAVDGPQHRGTVEGEEADDGDEVAGRMRGLLDREQRRAGSVQRGVEAHDPERPGAPGDERARRRVGAVVELAHRSEHPPLGLGAHVGAVVDHARDRLV